VATGFPGGSAYDALGPRLLPYIVAVGLVLTGLPILVGAFWQHRPAQPEALDLLPVILILIALLIAALLIRTIGWIPVAGLVFALGARAFGSRRVVLDLALGLTFGIVTFVLFNYGLGLNLPAGSWIR
jgi:putative tricarboxylic transport membrane protein